MIGTNPSSNNKILHFKNSIYQGNTSNHTKMKGSGFLYFFNDNSLIISQNYENNRINGPSIFIYGRTTYQYGTWKDDKPHGVCCFKINDILLIAEYSQGKIINNNQVFLFLEKNNIGVIMNYTPDSGFKFKYKQEIYCHEHTLKMMEKTGFQVDKICFSLLKFINCHFNKPNTCIRLRYVDSSLYRLWVQNGISMYFNEREEIQTFELEENTANNRVSPKKTGHIYNINETILSSQNQNLTNPSLEYIQQFKKGFNVAIMKSILSGCIKDINQQGNKAQIELDLNNKSIQIRTKDKKRKGQGTLSKIKHPSTSKIVSENSKQPQKQIHYVDYLPKYPPREDLREQINKIRSFFQNITAQNDEKVTKLNQQTQTLTQNTKPPIEQIITSTPERPNPFAQQKSSNSTKKKIFDFNVNKINRASNSSKKNKKKIFTQKREGKSNFFKEDQKQQYSQFDWEYEQQPPKTVTKALQAQIRQFTQTNAIKEIKQAQNKLVAPVARKNSSSIEDEDMTNLNTIGQHQKEKKKNQLSLKIQSKNYPYKLPQQKQAQKNRQVQIIRPKPQILSRPKSPLLRQKKRQKDTTQQSFKILIPHREGFPLSSQNSNKIVKEQRTRSYYLDLHARNLQL